MTSGSSASGPSGRLPFPPVMLAVAGASGSGKTTLAAELARTLGGLHFSLDSYYRDLGHLPLEDRIRQNFDDPAMIDVARLSNDMEALAANRPIQRPVYNFASYTCEPGQSETVVPGRLIVFEGLFTIYYPELRPYYQMSIFVDTPDDVCFARRLKRDVEERGRQPESVRRQYDATVRPCGLAFVRPLIDFADVVVDGTDPLDYKMELVINALRRRGLLARIGS